MVEFAQVEAAYRAFPDQVKSLMLSTVGAAGQPQASYAPFLWQGGPSPRLYIWVSGLAEHTASLLRTAQAGVLLIQDEAAAAQIFARQRLMYDCTAQCIERHDPQWTGLADRFGQRFGPIITTLRQLPDFQIFALTPQGGRFVLGFGAAYTVDPERLDRLMPPR